MRDLTERFGNDDSGGTSLEYGLIAAGIAVGLTMAMVSLGAQLKSNLAQI
jgi:Flp pilus assembly pilin Flp